MKEYISIRDCQMEYIESLERQLDDKNMALVVSNKDLQNKLQASVSELDIGNDEENLGKLCDLDFLSPRGSDQKISKSIYQLENVYAFYACNAIF